MLAVLKVAGRGVRVEAEIHQEVIVEIHMEDNGHLDQGDGRGGGKKGQNALYVLYGD